MNPSDGVSKLMVQMPVQMPLQMPLTTPPPQAQVQHTRAHHTRGRQLSRIVVGLSMDAAAVAPTLRPLAEWKAHGPFAS